MLGKALIAAAAMAGVAKAQVTATGTMGTTNPPQATLGTAINQTSYSRLLSLNAIDDFCIFGPPEPNGIIGNTEQIEVAWCMQPRNDARVIPDGTFTSVHLVKTPLYWQIQGFGDLTRINVANNDEGGELDPHGATGDGNPIGGNVTCNATGSDVSYQEWMNYISYNMFCLRICIAENSTYSAALECQHTLDEMGCEWVMPGDYTDDSFTECQGDSAYPPGIYPLANGSTSTFAQRYTGTYTNGGGSVGTFTVGYTSTPQTPYSIPATSMCTNYATVSNGIPLASLGVSGSVTTISGAAGNSSSSTMTMSGSSSMASSMMSASSSSTAAAGSSSTSKSSASGSSSASAAASTGGAIRGYTGTNYGPAVAGALSVVAVFAGAGAILL